MAAATTMRAVRIRPTAPDGTPYSFPGNVAPSSAIEVHDDVPVPQVSQPGELLVRIKASTVYRDNLEWNELYPPGNATLGNDFSGIVAAVHPGDDSGFRVGDHIYGMTRADRGGAYAEYTIVKADEAVKKPNSLSWEEAAAIPGSALTADQALFGHIGLEQTPAGSGGSGSSKKRVLITGAAGAVGTYLVPFAALAGHHVVAASSSSERNGPLLRSLGAHEVVEYSDFGSLEKVDVVVDACGSQVLADCWAVVKPDGGTILSFDSCSWGFREAHREQGISAGKEGVRALYMIAEPSRDSMERITEHVAKGNVKGWVAKTVALKDVREAYESAHTRGGAYGRIIVTV